MALCCHASPLLEECRWYEEDAVLQRVCSNQIVMIPSWQQDDHIKTIVLILHEHFPPACTNLSVHIPFCLQGNALIVHEPCLLIFAPGISRLETQDVACFQLAMFNLSLQYAKYYQRYAITASSMGACQVKAPHDRPAEVSARASMA